MKLRCHYFPFELVGVPPLDPVLVPGLEAVPLLPPPLDGMDKFAPALMLSTLLILLAAANSAMETPVLAEMAESVSPDLMV